MISDSQESTETIAMSESSQASPHSSTDSNLSASLLHKPQKGLGILVASVFIVGTICGSGVLAVPKAIVDIGYIGPVVLVACGITSSYTGTVLGKCWTVLRVRYPEYESERITDPYPTIAFRAGGKIAKHATTICIDITLFGGATVFLLLISGNVSQLLKDMGNIDFSLCYLILIVGGILTPLSWLGTPKDFWQAGVAAAVTSVLAAWLIFGSLVHAIPGLPPAEHSSPEVSNFFKAFGTILFAFGGASSFPTIQVDMKNPTKFPIAVVIGIINVMIVYFLVGLTGFILVGDTMPPNVVETLPAGGMSYTVNILITLHLLMASLIVLNPVSQEIEGIFNVPDKLCLKRIIIRTVLIAVAMFIALTIPHFDIILSLLGGSTIALTNFIFPPLFYYLLSRQRVPSAAYGELPSYIQPREEITADSSTFVSRHVQVSKNEEHENWMQIDIPLHIKVILFQIIFIGVVGGFSSTYFSFADLVSGKSSFTVPCYVDPKVGL